MKLKPIKQDGAWHAVSTIYRPARYMSIGSGVFFCAPYRTREACRKAIRRYYRTGKTP